MASSTGRTSQQMDGQWVISMQTRSGPLSRKRSAEDVLKILEPEDLLCGLELSKDGILLQAAVVLFGKEGRFLSEMQQCLLLAESW